MPAQLGRSPLPVVFAGYGVTAPELGYDDYAGLDVKGKIVVVFFFEAPAAFRQQSGPTTWTNTLSGRLLALMEPLA